MLFKTHIVSSLAVSEVILIISSNLFNFNILSIDFFIFLFFVFIGSIFPDIDEQNSKISKSLPPFISLYINRIFGHRGFTHSLLGISLITFLFYIILGDIDYKNSYIYGFFIGNILHVIGDMVTYSGISHFFTFNRNVIKLNFFGSFLVGSTYEIKLYLYFLSINLIYVIYLIYLSTYL